MKILFVGKRHYTNKDALEERFGRIFHLPEEWQKAGEDTRLWLIDYRGGRSESRRFGDWIVRSTPVLRPGFWGEFLRAWRWSPAVVVASGDCYIGLLGWLLAKLGRSRFVFDVYDKYDEFGGYVRPLGWDLFGFLRRASDLRFYSSAPLATRLEPEGAVPAIVPNGVDPDVFKPMARDDARRALGLDPAAILVGYFGGMEADRGVQDLVAAMVRLRAAGSRAELLVCGKRHAATPLDHDWIQYRGMVPHADMPLYINAMDVVAVPYRSTPFMDMGSSCKIGEYLMCERPLVSTRTPNFTGNFPRQAAQLGEALAAMEDPADLARALGAQLAHPVAVERPGFLAWPTIAASALARIRTIPGLRADDASGDDTRGENSHG